MKLKLENTFPYQIEFLPRITARFGEDWLIAVEWLFWGVYLASDWWFKKENVCPVCGDVSGGTHNINCNHPSCKNT